MGRYKNASMEAMYRGCLALACDVKSEFYNRDGSPRRGAGHRCAFWDGYAGLKRSANAVPGTLSWAAFNAGREMRRRSRSIKG